MTASYLYNPQLPIINKDYKGNRYEDGKFWNEDGKENVSLAKFLKWRFTRNPQKEEKAVDTYRVQVLENNTFADSTKDMIVWLGHATFFIRLGGVTMLTDPLFFHLPFIPRRSPLPCHPSHIKGIKYVLISHGHRDHLDKDSIAQVLKYNPEVEILAPLSMQKLLNSFGTITQYQEAGWYQQYKTIQGVDIYFLPAQHWHRRGLNDLNHILWGSFLIKTGNISVYFGGDSAYSSIFKDIRQIVGNIDISILPIGAYKPAFMMQGSHMNPQEAVQAATDLQSKVLIPMHYGTFDLSDEPISEPITRLKQLEQNHKLSLELKALAIGEEYYL